MAKLYAPGQKVIRKELAENKELSTWNPLNYIAKIPTYAWQALRSAPGLQNIQQNEDILRQLSGQQTNQYPIAVSPEQARQEAAQVLPDIMTRKLSGDWLAEQAVRELPIASATGGLSSVPAAGKYALKSIAGNIGSSVGGSIGGRPGALAGGIIGSGIPDYIAARKVLAPLSPTSKQEDIRNYENSIKKIDTQRSKWYEKARSLESDAKGNASKLIEVINKEKEGMYKGLREPEQQEIQKLIYQLEDNIQRNNGELSLRDAKDFKENYNAVIYGRNTPKTVKRSISRVNEPLREFINQTGSPEHTKAYNKADKLSQKMFEQIREEPQIISELNDLRRQVEKSSRSGALESILKHKQLSGLASSLGAGILSLLGLPYAGIAATGAAGLTAGLGIYNEGKMLANAAKNNPKLFKKFTETLAEASVDNTFQTINRLNSISNKMKIPTQENKKKKRGLFLPSQR